MKKILLIALISILYPIMGLAVEYNIGSYRNSYDGKSYSVDVRLKNNEIDQVYIYMATKSGVTGYFNFRGKNLDKFYKALCSMSPKFAEWSATAIENNVSSFSKEFDVKLPKGNLFWIGNQTYIAVRQKLDPFFMVSDGKPMFMLLGYAKALQNKYISETFNLVFVELEDYENFVEIFNPDNALKKALENQTLTDKFN